MKDQGHQTYGPWAKTGPTSGFNPARLMILKFKKYIKNIFIKYEYLLIYLIYA